MIVLRAASLVAVAVIALVWVRDDGRMSARIHLKTATEQLEQGRHPQALAAYHRALASDPSHRTAVQGRNFCRRELGEVGFADGWFPRLSGDALLALACLSVAVIILGIVRWSLPRDRASFAMLACGGFGCMLVVLGMLLVQRERWKEPIRVVVDTTSLRTGNNIHYPQVGEFPLPPGAEVRVKSIRGGWYRVARPDGAVGWLPTACLIGRDNP